MRTESSVVAALAMALSSQQALGFHIQAPATSTRWLQQRQSRPTSSFSRPAQEQRQHHVKPRSPSGSTYHFPSSRSLRPLSAVEGADDGDGGEGFSSGGDKVSRKAAKKAKARGGAPVIPASKKSTQQPQQVSKAAVADVLAAQGVGVDPADQVAARKAIENMEKLERERLEERQARIDSVLAAKAAAVDDPDAGSIPEIVANRMLQRMIPFFLLPAFGGIGVFVGVYVLSHKYDYTIPAYVVAYATQAPFFIALSGITYAILSASWDEEREGTFFGFDEAKRNVGNIVEGLRRSSDRMDVEDMLADQEQQNLNRYQRRQMRKEQDDSGSGGDSGA